MYLPKKDFLNPRFRIMNCLGPREAKENGGEREQEREEENGPKNEAT